MAAIAAKGNVMTVENDDDALFDAWARAKDTGEAVPSEDEIPEAEEVIETETPEEEVVEDEPEATEEDEPEEGETKDEPEEGQPEEAPEEQGETNGPPKEGGDEYWKHRYDSDIGRISAYQRQNSELKQELEALKKPGANPENSGVSDEEWEKLKEDYPDIAASIERKNNAMEQRHASEMNELREQIKPLQDEKEERYFKDQLTALTNAHPDWEEIVNTPEYKGWLNNQPQEVQGYMERTDASSNIYLLDLYKVMTRPATPQPEQPNVELQEKRKKQLNQGRTITNRAAPKPKDILEDADEDALFEHYAAKKDSRQ